MSRRLPGLIAIVVIVGLSVAMWIDREQPPHQRTPLDVGAIAELDVRYGPEERNLLDVYVPSTPGPHPVIVYFHHGGWVAGDKSLSLLIWDWTERGYAVVSANYTLASGSGSVRDSVHDAEAAMRFVIDEGERWNLDTDTLGIFGFSAGGHLAAMLSQTDLPLSAVAMVGAPTDLVGLLAPGTEFFDGASGAAVTTLMQDRLGCGGRSTDWCEREAIEMSPTEGIAGSAPVMIVHGGLDPIVDPSQAIALDRALRDQGADVELVVVPGGTHRPETDALEAFFDRLMLSSAAD